MIDVDENGDMNDVVMNTTTTSATTDSNNTNNNNANWVGDQPMKNENATGNGNVKGTKTVADKKDKSQDSIIQKLQSNKIYDSDDNMDHNKKATTSSGDKQ